MAGAFKRSSQRKGGGRWTASYVDEHGKRQHKRGYTDKARTLELARKLEAEARMVRDGLLTRRDQTAAIAATKPIAEHIEAFRGFLAAKGNTATHVSQVASVLTRLFSASGVTRLAEMRPERLQASLASIRGSRSPRTANHALGSLKSFLRFLDASGRLAEAPGWAKLLKPYSEHVDRKRVRRVLTATEVRLLLEATRKGPAVETRRGQRAGKRDPGAARVMTGHHRYWLYRLALETGLRASELGSLTPESFDLDAGTVTVAAAYSKHRREDTLPLAPFTIMGLGAFFVLAPRGQPIFPIPAKCGEMLAKDLKAAHIPIETAAGVIDFHSLRHTFISGLVERGTDVKTAQELARHSTPNLTIGRYSHTTEARKRAAIEAIDAKEGTPRGEDTGDAGESEDA